MRSSWNTTWWLLGKVTKRLLSYFSRPEPALETPTVLLDEQGMPLPSELLERLYSKVDKTYYPSSLDSGGVLFRTYENGGQAVRALDDMLGWKDLFTRGLEIIPLAGDHFSIFPDQIPTIAREVNRVLRQRSPSQGKTVNFDADKP